MEVSEILSAIGTYGVAIVVTAVLLWFGAKLITRILDDKDKTQERLYELQHESSEAINNNTKILTELLAYLRGGK